MNAPHKRLVLLAQSVLQLSQAALYGKHVTPGLARLADGYHGGYDHAEDEEKKETFHDIARRVCVSAMTGILPEAGSLGELIKFDPPLMGWIDFAGGKTRMTNPE
jgi:hypothetical protein